ncbi:unnamed protein product [Ilex paraguariensis]|uniref:Uncharacterized protein n=1 Tax=Ilex paraguariensis TaxID=185542 RepID=A0ABC8QR13_9AQUA
MACEGVKSSGGLDFHGGPAGASRRSYDLQCFSDSSSSPSPLPPPSTCRAHWDWEPLNNLYITDDIMEGVGFYREDMPDFTRKKKRKQSSWLGCMQCLEFLKLLIRK